MHATPSLGDQPPESRLGSQMRHVLAGFMALGATHSPSIKQPGHPAAHPPSQSGSGDEQAPASRASQALDAPRLPAPWQSSPVHGVNSEGSPPCSLPETPTFERAPASSPFPPALADGFKAPACGGAMPDTLRSSIEQPPAMNARLRHVARRIDQARTALLIRTPRTSEHQATRHPGSQGEDRRMSLCHINTRACLSHHASHGRSQLPYSQYDPCGAA